MSYWSSIRIGGRFRLKKQTKNQKAGRIRGRLDEKECLRWRERVSREGSRRVPGINVMKTTFELALNPDWEGVITAESSLTGSTINRLQFGRRLSLLFADSR